MAYKIKKGDNVFVLSGKYKGSGSSEKLRFSGMGKA